MRLEDIDAPESEQSCRLRGGTRWPCGQRATQALTTLIACSEVRCTWSERDRCDRALATCFAAKKNVNANLVSRGWAVAYRRYSDCSVPEEERTESTEAGIWRGEFVAPWDWRRGERLDRSRTPSSLWNEAMPEPLTDRARQPA